METVCCKEEQDHSRKKSLTSEGNNNDDDVGPRPQVQHHFPSQLMNTENVCCKEKQYHSGKPFSSKLLRDNDDDVGIRPLRQNRFPFKLRMIDDAEREQENESDKEYKPLDPTTAYIAPLCPEPYHGAVDPFTLQKISNEISVGASPSASVVQPQPPHAPAPPPPNLICNTMSPQSEVEIVLRKLEK